MRDSLIILGSGYTARFLRPLAERRYARVFATSRNPEENLRDVAADRRLRFDLSRSDTWTQIPDQGDLLWCFPAMPVNLIRQFVEKPAPVARRLVVLGSTSAYEPPGSDDYPPPWIDERAPIDLSKPRVQGEEFLRDRWGAVVLRVAGIYGPGRNPIDWMRSGRVSPSRKYVNLIHVEDLAAVCLAALERGTPGETYNVSDGTPRTWDEISRSAQARWGIPRAPSNASHETGKRISNRKLVQELAVAMRHPDLYAAPGVL